MFACFRSTSVLEHARLDLLLPPRASRVLLDGAGARRAKKQLAAPGWIFSCPRVRVAFSWTVRVRAVPKAACSAGSAASNQT
jgi:hypothetical protein